MNSKKLLCTAFKNCFTCFACCCCCSDPFSVHYPFRFFLQKLKMDFFPCSLSRTECLCTFDLCYYHFPGISKVSQRISFFSLSLHMLARSSLNVEQSLNPALIVFQIQFHRHNRSPSLASNLHNRLCQRLDVLIQSAIFNRRKVFHVSCFTLEFQFELNFPVERDLASAQLPLAHFS